MVEPKVRRSSLGPVKVGLLGLGTVGLGTLKVLERNQKEISRRAGRNIVVSCASVKDPLKDRGYSIEHIKVYDDPFELVSDPELEVVVELIGGCELAKSLVLKALAHNKQVITANKALIAEHGNAIFSQAQRSGLTVAFEGAVAGGIPIIKTIREGLGANHIQWLAGIINGTSNYILTKMYECGWEFEAAYEEANRLGFCEKDPRLDLHGVDAAHKMAILGSIAFGIPLQFSNVLVEGIDSIELTDVRYAKELGFEIKHLGFSRRCEQGIEIRVHPTLIPSKCLLAHVQGVMNAVLIQADAVGPSMYYGAGAGAEPTASAVVADIIEVSRTLGVASKAKVPYLAFQSHALADTPIVQPAQIKSRYYLRIHVEDKPGILAQITKILGERGISIKCIVQKPAHTQSGQVPVIILTDQVVEGNILSAIDHIEVLNGVVDKVIKIRVEHLDYQEAQL